MTTYLVMLHSLYDPEDTFVGLGSDAVSMSEALGTVLAYAAQEGAELQPAHAQVISALARFAPVLGWYLVKDHTKVAQIFIKESVAIPRW